MLYSNNIANQTEKTNLYRIQSGAIAMIALAFFLTLYLPLLLLFTGTFKIHTLLKEYNITVISLKDY